MKGDPRLDDIKALLKELDERQKKSARRSARFRRSTARHIDGIHSSIVEMQGSFSRMRKAVKTMESSVTSIHTAVTTMGAAVTTMETAVTSMGLAVTTMETAVTNVGESLGRQEKSVLGLRADVDQLEAGHQKQEQDIGRVAQAVNAFVDGYDLRFERLEERVTRLEQKSA